MPPASVPMALFSIWSPAINGIKNGATYYVTQSVTVTDENLDSVTINGSEMTGEPFSLAGDTGANYTIIATDKAGSTTEYNVTMKPIENLIESIADLTTGNVTSDDQETVKSVKKIKAVDTEEEKQALQEITDKCDKLPEKIKKVMKVIEGIETRLDDYTIQTVTPDNESELKQLKEDTEQLIDEAKKQYDALTEYEKILVNEEPREKLASLLAALGDYEIIKGDVGK